MSVFGNIVSAIFGSKHAASVTGAAASSAPSPSAGSAKGASAPSPSPSPAPAAGASPASAGASTVSATAAKTISKADVEAILAKLADDQDEDYDWKRSIVDLMKLLKLDSGLGARKQLAQELGYTGALDGSAEMNVWLHKQVMTKLAESGGKVPDSLKA
jgi:3-oxoacyl-ACP reductase-like protein